MKSIIDKKTFAIFSQAPTPEGIDEFWEAIYEKNVKLIVMLCKFVDEKKRVFYLLTNESYILLFILVLFEKIFFF